MNTITQQLAEAFKKKTGQPVPDSLLEKMDKLAQDAYIQVLPEILRDLWKTEPTVKCITPPHPDRADRIPSGVGEVIHHEEVWSGRSGRAGDGELLGSLEERYWYPKSVRLTWELLVFVDGVNPLWHGKPPSGLRLHDIPVTRASEASGEMQAEWYPSAELSLTGAIDGEPNIVHRDGRVFVVASYTVRGTMKEVR
jgi:hypothetical protein